MARHRCNKLYRVSWRKAFSHDPPVWLGPTRLGLTRTIVGHDPLAWLDSETRSEAARTGLERRGCHRPAVGDLLALAWRPPGP